MPFSVAGKGEGADDGRDGFPAVMAAIRRVRPLVVEIENVANLINHEEVLSGVVDELTEQGYYVRVYRVDASQYGVPQKRVRIFICGSLLGPIEAPPPEARAPPTVWEALGPDTPFNAFSTYSPEHELTPIQVERAARLDVLSNCARPRELHLNEPARTLTATNLANDPALMIRLRMDDGVTLQKPTHLQAARLQSFPAHHEYPSDLISKRQAYIAIGNAVPSRLGWHLTVQARRHIEEARLLWRKAREQGTSEAAPGVAAVGDSRDVCSDDDATEVASDHAAGPPEATEEAMPPLSDERALITCPRSCGASVTLLGMTRAERGFAVPNSTRVIRVTLDVTLRDDEQLSCTADAIEAFSRTSWRSRFGRAIRQLGRLRQAGRAAELASKVARRLDAGHGSVTAAGAWDGEAVPTVSMLSGLSRDGGSRLMVLLDVSFERPLWDTAVEEHHAEHPAWAEATRRRRACIEDVRAQRREGLQRRTESLRAATEEAQRERVEVETDEDSEAETDEDSGDEESEAPAPEQPPQARPRGVGLVLACLAVAQGLASYGPGDASTTANLTFNYQADQQRRAARAAPRIAAASRSSFGGGAGKLRRGPIHGGVAPAGSERPRTPLTSTSIGYQTKTAAADGEFYIRPIETLLDTGAGANVIDSRTARRAEREGAASVTRWKHAQPKALSAAGGGTIMARGECYLTLCVRDEYTESYKRFEALFYVVDAGPTCILGVPFFSAHKGRPVFSTEGTPLEGISDAGVRLSHEGVEVCVAAATDEDALERTVAALDVSRPLAFTTEEYSLAAGSGVGTEVQVPLIYANQSIVFYPLPDVECGLFANQRGLRLHGPVAARVDGHGKVKLRLNNPGSARVLLPACTAIAQYDVSPDFVPAQKPMPVDEIVAAVHVEGDTEEERAAKREVLKQTLFRDRAARSHYFSLSRVGRGVGCPDAVLEPTAEFTASGKAPPSTAARPLNPEQEAAAKKYYNEMVEQGQLVPSSSPFSSALVMVRKPKGGWRLALDYRAVNEVLVKQHYTLPNVRQCLDSLAKSTHFTSIDMISAFWQAPLSADSRKYTAVQFPWGRYEYTSVAMGLQAASAIFQKNMDIALAGLQPEVAISYIDDVLIHTAGSLDDHMIAVARVLDRIGGAGYTIRPDKTFIGVRSIEFLGHRIGGGTVKPDDSKTAQITKSEFPKDPASLQHWVGLVKYYSMHVERMALRLAPLQDRINSKSTQSPTAAELNAFSEIKAELTDPARSTLLLPRMDRTMYLLCDAASTKGAGCILVQRDDEGRERPVAYWSRRWVGGEERWHPLLHECCCVHDAVKRFGNYLHEKFYIITDAEPLVYLKKAKLKGKLASWALELQSYDFEVIHRPGHLHRAADAVSRLADVIAPHIAAIRTRASQPLVGFRRKRVTATVFSTTHVLIHKHGDEYQLPAANRRVKLEPLREVAARALEPILEHAGIASDIIGGNGYCLPEGQTRHVLVPCAHEEVQELVASAHTFWLDLTDPLLRVKSCPWAHVDDRRMVMRLQALVSAWIHGHVDRKRHHLALLAACDAAVMQRGLLRRPDIAALAAPRPRCKLRGTEAIDDGLVEGRMASMQPISDPAQGVEALRAIAEWVDACRRNPDFMPRAAGERDAVCAAAVDFEYCNPPRRGRNIELVQVAIGPYALVFDAHEWSPVLGAAEVAPGVPSLAHWLQSPLVIKSVQACDGDADRLSRMGLRMCPVFDTSAAELILTRASQQSGLHILVSKYVAPGLMLEKARVKSEGFDVFGRRPLPDWACRYSWQDVAWGVQLMMAQRRALLDATMLDALYEKSRMRADRDRTMMPDFTYMLRTLWVECSGSGAWSVAVSARSTRVAANVTVAEGRVRLMLTPSMATCALPATVLGEPLLTAAPPGTAGKHARTAVIDQARSLLGGEQGLHAFTKPLATLRKRRWISGALCMNVPVNLRGDADWREGTGSSREIWHLDGSGLRFVRLQDAAAMAECETDRRAILHTTLDEHFASKVSRDSQPSAPPLDDSGAPSVAALAPRADQAARWAGEAIHHFIKSLTPKRGHKDMPPLGDRAAANVTEQQSPMLSPIFDLGV